MDIQEISINHDIHLAWGGKHFEKKKMVVASIYTPTNLNVLEGILESACLSVHSSIHVSIYVQNTSFCQSAGGGIKSHLVTALVPVMFSLFR